MLQKATYGYVLLGKCLFTLLMGFQRYIRGSGLAYGASIWNDTEAGLLTFSLYRVRLWREVSYLGSLSPSTEFELYCCLRPSRESRARTC